MTRHEPGRGDLGRTTALFPTLNFRDKRIIEGLISNSTPRYPLSWIRELGGQRFSPAVQGVSRVNVGDQVSFPLGRSGSVELHARGARGSSCGSLPGVLADMFAYEQGDRLPGYLTAAEKRQTCRFAALTAWVALFTARQNEAGETVLLQGSGGRFRLFALQLAGRMALRVFVTSRATCQMQV